MIVRVVTVFNEPCELHKKRQGCHERRGQSLQVPVFHGKRCDTTAYNLHKRTQCHFSENLRAGVGFHVRGIV